MPALPDGAVILWGLEGAFEGMDGHISIYNWEGCIDCLVEGGLTHDEAIEHLDFNTLGSRDTCYPHVRFRDEHGELF